MVGVQVVVAIKWTDDLPVQFWARNVQCAARGCFLPPRVFPLDAVVVMVWISRTTGALVVTYCTCAAVRVRVGVCV